MTMYCPRCQGTSLVWGAFSSLTTAYRCCTCHLTWVYSVTIGTNAPPMFGEVPMLLPLPEDASEIVAAADQIVRGDVG